MRLRLLLLAVLLAFVAVAGCGAPPYKAAPVSGVVKVNGKPLAGADVQFAPVAAKGKSDPGPTSWGKTDAEGKYTLQLQIKEKTPGAVVGKARVFISKTMGGAAPGAEQADAGGPKERETVPRRYNQETTLEFTVPEAGSTSANFDLKSP